MFIRKVGIKNALKHSLPGFGLNDAQVYLILFHLPVVLEVFVLYDQYHIRYYGKIKMKYEALPRKN